MQQNKWNILLLLDAVFIFIIIGSIIMYMSLEKPFNPILGETY